MIKQVEVKSEAKADWRREWISALYLNVRSGAVDLQEEYLVYDFQVSDTFSFCLYVHNHDDCFCPNFQDLLSDLGGYLGLLLGWYISYPLLIILMTIEDDLINLYNFKGRVIPS